MGNVMFGLQVTAIGISVVFTALISLVFVISIQEKILSGIGKKMTIKQ